jgi:hypothetical protein
VTPATPRNAIAPLRLDEALRVEFACLAEFAHFIRRHRRYLVIFFMLYWHSLFAWRARRGLRVAFCLAQRLDDILDGDRITADAPLAAAARVRRQIAAGTFAANLEGLLAHAVAWELDVRANHSEGTWPRNDFLALIDTLCRDRERIDARRVLDRTALDAHLADTFSRSLDMHLLLAGSRMRTRDVAPLIACFAHCSVLRDLDDDIAHGICNAPVELLASCGVAGFPADAGALRHHPAFHAWVRGAAAISLPALDAAETLLQTWPDRKDPGLRVLYIFTRSLRDFFTRRVRKLYPEAFESTAKS